MSDCLVFAKDRGRTCFFWASKDFLEIMIERPHIMLVCCCLKFRSNACPPWVFHKAQFTLGHLPCLFVWCFLISRVSIINPSQCLWWSSSKSWVAARLFSSNQSRWTWPLKPKILAAARYVESLVNVHSSSTLSATGWVLTHTHTHTVNEGRNEQNRSILSHTVLGELIMPCWWALTACC